MKKALILSIAFLLGSNILYSQDSSNIRKLSSINTGGFHYGILPKDTLVYLAVDTEGVKIFNCANPRYPNSLPWHNTPGMANDIRFRSGHLFVADGTCGLRVLSTNIPATELGYYDTPGFANAIDFYSYYAYVADMSGLAIINISNPLSPSLARYYDMGLTYSVTLDTNNLIAYCANEDSGFTILNINDPSNITLIAKVPVPDKAYKVALSNNNIAFVACGNAGLRAYDVTNYVTPTFIGSCNTPDVATWVVLRGSYAFVATHSTGIRIIDIENPAQMVEVGFYDPSAGTAFMVELDHHYIYLANGAGGFYILQSYIPPKLIQPANNSYMTSLPSFDWKDTPFSFSYNLQIGLNNFNHIIKDTIVSSSECMLPIQLDNGTYVWRVCASDGLGGWSPWSPVWTFTVDTIPPTIDVINSKITSGSDYIFMAEVDKAGPGNISSVKLYWDQAGGGGTLKQFDLQRVGATDTFQVVVPGSDIPPRGVQFRLEAQDSAGNTRWWPNMAGDFFIRSVHFPTSLQKSIEHDVWQMISIPTDARGRNIFHMLADEFGSYDKAKWRLFQWHQGDYKEIDSPTNNLAQIGKLGQAYWLRKREGPNDIVFEGPDSTYGNFVPSAAEAIVLAPGWNDIGSPYLFPIDWTSVTPTQSNIFGPYFYGASQSRWMYPPEVTDPGSNLPFRPYLGYAYRNDNATPVNLMIYPYSQPKNQAITQPKYKVWQAKLILRNARGSDHNYFGFSSAAQSGRDEWDYPEPPSELTGTSGFFLIEEQPFCSDLRPFGHQPETWDFVVRCHEQENCLSLELPPDTDPDLRCYLVDQERNLAFDLRSDPIYRFLAGPGEEQRHFRLLVCRSGQEGWLADMLTLPKTSQITRASPNPFHGRVILDYQICSESKVSLGIYNISGQRVRTLVEGLKMPGYYHAIWDGRDDAGQQLGSGIYIARISADQFSSSQRIVLIR